MFKAWITELVTKYPKNALNYFECNLEVPRLTFFLSNTVDMEAALACL